MQNQTTSNLTISILLAASLCLPASAGSGPIQRNITPVQFEQHCLPQLLPMYALHSGELLQIQHYTRAGDIYAARPAAVVPAPESYRVHTLIDAFALLYIVGCAPVPTIITKLDPLPAVGDTLTLRLATTMRMHTIKIKDGKELTCDVRIQFDPPPATAADLLRAFNAGRSFEVVLPSGTPPAAKLYRVSKK